MNTTEEWRAVQGWEGFYEVSSHGRVRSIDRSVTKKASAWRRDTVQTFKGRILKPAFAFGYPKITLSRDGVTQQIAVHILVAAAFIGPRPVNMEVAHEDGIPSNPCASNLRYDSHKGNLSDKPRHGTRTGGPRHPVAKLTQQQVDEIKDLRSRGMLFRELAALYPVGRAHLGQICNGNKWKP